MILNVVFVVQL